MEEKNSENEKLWENEADNFDSFRRFQRKSPEEKERLVREFVDLDEIEIARALGRIAARPLRGASKEFAETLTALYPYITRFYETWPDESEAEPYYTVNSSR
jgi:hypothetical protein